MASSIVRNLCFCYQNLNWYDNYNYLKWKLNLKKIILINIFILYNFSCFFNEGNHCSLDKYFTIIFSELLDVNMFHNIESSHEFEKYLPVSKSIPLLRSIQVNIKQYTFYKLYIYIIILLDGTR